MSSPTPFSGSHIPARVFTGPTWTPNNAWIVGNDYEVALVRLDRLTADAGSPISGVLRAGLVLGKITSGGDYVDYDDDGTDDGRRTAAAILLSPIDMRDPTDPSARLTEPIFAQVMIRGRIQTTGLIGYDANAKTDLKAIGFFFEDDV